MRIEFWFKLAAALAVIWLVAALAIHFARAAQPTPDSVAAYLRVSMGDRGLEERARRIARAADLLNRLSFEQRQQLRGQHAQDEFFRQLTPDEQGRFLDATLPTGFKQMMENFNKMDPAKRKQFVERALTEMKKREGQESPRGLDDANAQKIVNQGLRSFYNDASADVKLDLAPLIEQMQKSNFSR